MEHCKRELFKSFHNLLSTSASAQSTSDWLVISHTYFSEEYQLKPREGRKLTWLENISTQPRSNLCHFTVCRPFETLYSARFQKELVCHWFRSWLGPSAPGSPLLLSYLQAVKTDTGRRADFPAALLPCAITPAAHLSLGWRHGDVIKGVQGGWVVVSRDESELIQSTLPANRFLTHKHAHTHTSYIRERSLSGLAETHSAYLSIILIKCVRDRDRGGERDVMQHAKY